VSEEIKPGTLRGTVKILGVPPKRMKLRIDVDPKCAALHSGDLLADNIVVIGEQRPMGLRVREQGKHSVDPGPLPPVQLDQWAAGSSRTCWGPGEPAARHLQQRPSAPQRAFAAVREQASSTSAFRSRA
jgi:hypothetical protein